MGTDKPLLNFVIEPDLLKRLDDFRFKHRFATRAAAIKEILAQYVEIDESLGSVLKSRQAQGQYRVAEAMAKAIRKSADEGDTDAVSAKLDELLVLVRDMVRLEQTTRLIAEKIKSGGK